jgi:hypothetical protein
MDFVAWLNNLLADGLSATTNRYYSIYRAIVTNNKDPMSLGRVQIQCVTAGHDQAPDVWVVPAMPAAGVGRGMFFVPEVGDTVFVNFYEGDPSMPELYFGGWYGQVTSGQSDVPQFLQPTSGGYPEKKGFTTRAGHSLIFDDTGGKESITMLWNQPDSGDPAVNDRTKTAAYNSKVSTILTFDKNGVMLKTPSSFVLQFDESKKAVTLTANGAFINITSSGNVSVLHPSGANILVSSNGITLSASPSQGQNVNLSGTAVSLNAGAINLGGKAADFAVLGLKLIAWLAKHTHPYAFGVTLPPVPPPTPADFCSTSIKVQM